MLGTAGVAVAMSLGQSVGPTFSVEVGLLLRRGKAISGSSMQAAGPQSQDARLDHEGPGIVCSAEEHVLLRCFYLTRL
eukprot:71808-Pleurochrysis_carterae.AAC.1